MDAALAAGLAPADLDLLCADGRIEAVARRRVVPLDGATMVVVLSGYFRIFRHAAFVRDVTLGLAARGDVLAPGVAFGDRAAETGAEALGGGRVLHLAPAVWQAHSAERPDLNLKMAVSIGKRISRLHKKLEEFSRTGVEGRVASTLLDLATDFGSCIGGDRGARRPDVSGGDRGARRPDLPEGAIELDVPLSQDDLARLAGTTRETCSSTVAGFARRGLVLGGRLRGLVLLDPEALAALAEAGSEGRRGAPAPLTGDPEFA